MDKKEIEKILEHMKNFDEKTSPYSVEVNYDIDNKTNKIIEKRYYHKDEILETFAKKLWNNAIYENSHMGVDTDVLDDEDLIQIFAKEFNYYKVDDLYVEQINIPNTKVVVNQRNNNLNLIEYKFETKTLYAGITGSFRTDDLVYTYIDVDIFDSWNIVRKAKYIVKTNKNNQINTQPINTVISKERKFFEKIISK